MLVRIRPPPTGKPHKCSIRNKFSEPSFKGMKTHTATTEVPVVLPCSHVTMTYRYDHIGPTEETKQMKFPHQPHQYALR